MASHYDYSKRLRIINPEKRVASAPTGSGLRRTRVAGPRRILSIIERSGDVRLPHGHGHQEKAGADEVGLAPQNNGSAQAEDEVRLAESGAREKSGERVKSIHATFDFLFQMA
jgi:hypothetical protein